MTLIDELNRSEYVQKVEKELNLNARFLATLLQGMPKIGWDGLRDIIVITATGKLTVEVPLHISWRWSWLVRRRVIKHIRATESAKGMTEGFVNFRIPEIGYSTTLVYHRYPDEQFAIPHLPMLDGSRSHGLCQDSVRYSARSIDLEELAGTHQIYRVS